MSDQIERTQPNIDRLETFPARLQELLQGQSEAALKYRPQEDAWSVTETLGHLMVFDARWGNRIRQVLAADDPKFIFADPNDAVQRFEFNAQQPEVLLTSFSERRAERVAFFRSLGPDSLVRTGTDSDGRKMSVADAIELLVANDSERSAQIKATLDAFERTAKHDA